MASDQTVENRRAVRDRMIKGGQAVFGGSSLDCVILDLSSGGARLHRGTVADIPDSVILRLPDGTTRPAQRRWRRGAESGFEFLPGMRGLIRIVS